MTNPPPAARHRAAVWNGDRITRAEIAWAVPPGSRRARSQGQWLAALARDRALDDLRADRRHNVLEVGRYLARRASWQDRTTMPVRSRLCAALGIGMTTWKACRRWLEDHGYLGTVRKGRMARFRRVLAAVLDNDRNDAAVYVLAVRRSRPAAPAPADPVTRPPTGSRSEPGTNHTRETPENTGKPALPLALRCGRVLENLSDRAVSCFWRPFERAGWSVADWRYAIDHLPTGRPHRRDLTDVIYPAGWLRWRLAHWTDSDGRPVPSRSQRAAARLQLERAHRARLRAELERLAAAAVPPTPAYLEARQQLAARPR